MFYRDLYNNQINARALIGQSAVGYCEINQSAVGYCGKLVENSRVF